MNYVVDICFLREGLTIESWLVSAFYVDQTTIELRDQLGI